MLKILEGNSIGTVIRAYSKQFAVWATDLKNKYFGDPFFRSESNVIILQIMFAASIILLVALYFNHIYEDVSRTIIAGIAQSLSQGGFVSGDNIAREIEQAKTNNFLAFIAIMSLITTGFSYFIAHVTLTPVRNALTSQKRFISDIAHELRTPLSIIKTNTEVTLLDQNIGTKLRKTLVSNIEELNRTSDIINNLLSFSNLIRPEKVNFTNVELGAIVGSALMKMQELAQKKEIEINSAIRGEYIVWGNATALQQIVINLLKNAVSYTPRLGRVDIRLEPDYQNNIVLYVKDTGVGISGKDLIHIFEPFYRAERSRNRQLGSSGLGLTIVSELVKLHSGKIIIKSTLNKGTEAIVWLPSSSKNKTNGLNKAEEDQIAIDFRTPSSSK